MSDYRDLVREEATAAYESLGPEFTQDAGEHGGASAAPNLGRWLDRTRKLLDRLAATCKDWGKSERMMVTQNSRNAVAFGDPKEAAYFAFYKDVLAELKKLHKQP